MAELLFEIIGWFGTIMILSAYFLLTKKTIRSEQKIFGGMNLIGGISIVVNALANGAYPPAVLNIIWSLIAIYGLLKSFKK